MAARGLLRLTGEQRVWFLQQTITADVDDLADGEWRESCFLDPKGHVLAHFRVGALGEELWLDIDPPAEPLADWLTRYRFRTKVDIEDRSSSSVTAATHIAAPYEVVRVGDAIVFGDTIGDMKISVIHGRIPDGAVPIDDDEVDRIRIEAGVARFGVDYTSDNLPQEAGLTRIVPVDKGCYVGQETVARIHFRGHVNRCVRPMRLSGVSDAVGHSLVLDGTTIGRITSATDDAAIGMVRVEPAEGVEVDVEGGGTATLGAVPEGTKVKT